MTREELSQEMINVAYDMESLATSMTVYGQGDDRALQHADELRGAAEMLEEWSDEI